MVALALANLCFASAWQRRIYGVPFFTPLGSWQDLAALVFNVIALAVCFCVVLWLAETKRVWGYRWDGLIYAIPLFPILNMARRAVFPFQHGSIASLVIASVPVVIALALFFRQSSLLPVAEFIMIGVALLFPLNVLQETRVIGKSVPATGSFATPPVIRHPSPRVIWIIFDEMDFSLSFLRRPVDLHTPEFDRLRSESLFATAAHQAAADTQVAIPALIVGRKIKYFEARDKRTYMLSFAPGDPPRDWSALPNVLSDVRAAQLNVGVVGWYFPYCRIFSGVLTECQWEPAYVGLSDKPSFWDSVFDQLDSLTPVEARARAIRRIKRMVKASLTVVDEPDLGLILLHLPIPHWPPIFDRTSGRITLFNLRKDWYFDNLLLADEVLGEIRAAMERSGQWEKSALIVTSDHSLRPSMMAHPNPTPLVPFMVKMPRQTTGMTFDAPFNTILTRDLIVAILSGRVTSESLPGWLQAMSASSEAEAQ